MMNVAEYYRYYEASRRRRLRAAAAAVAVISSILSQNRRTWVRGYVSRRKQQGVHHNLFLELSLEDPDKYRRCLRMDTATFEYLLGKVSPLISKRNTHLRESIPASERLSITLRHLATGKEKSQESLHLSFRVGQSTVSGIIKETCKALYTVLAGEFLRFPSTANDWKTVAEEFGLLWNFHNCIGALDGKHIRMDPPLQSGSMFFNYKDFYSIVLLALVDARLRFIFVDIGANGRQSDRGIWGRCSLKKYLEDSANDFPSPSALPGTNDLYPHVVVGDEGFTLSPKLLIPYPAVQLTNRNDRRIFNYRLSRARRCSENAFGVLGARFQIFRAAIRYDPDDTRDIVLACCCLHNMLRTQAVGQQMYTPNTFLDVEDEASGTVTQGQYRDAQVNGFANLGNQGSNHHPTSALQLREKWCAYFNGAGRVPWQDRMIHLK